MDTTPKTTSAIQNNRTTEPEPSQDDTKNMLSAALKESLGKKADAWIQDVFSDWFVYQTGPSQKLYRQDFAFTNQKPTLKGKPSEVIKVTEYRPVKNHDPYQKLGPRQVFDLANSKK